VWGVGCGEKGETIHDLGVNRTIKNGFSIICRSFARQGFEDYISRKLSLFFSLPHKNEKSLKSDN
jgi:hypothetical protein